MELTGGELVARVLKQAGVGHIFTLCGGHILPVYDGCLGEDIGVIDVRHEQAAAHAADAHARLTRNVGVAVVTAGPGVTDAVTGVANAYAARSPLLLIGGAAPLGLRGLGALQEMEQVALLRPITKGAWSVAETRQIPEVLTTAIRTALAGRPGPVFVEIPVDLLLNRVEDRLAPIPTAYTHRPRNAPDAAALAEHANVLARAGLEGEPFGERTFLLRTVPRSVRGRDVGALVRALAAELAEDGASAAAERATDAALATVACHSVVRVGQRLDAAEVHTLLAAMDGVEISAHCPHGRPVAAELGRAQLEALFRR